MKEEDIERWMLQRAMDEEKDSRVLSIAIKTAVFIGASLIFWFIFRNPYRP